jgi:hypothetical protein
MVSSFFGMREALKLFIFEGEICNLPCGSEGIIGVIKALLGIATSCELSIGQA